METSAAGLKALMLREGFKTKAYKDVKGIWTIGVGHTSAAGPPTVTAGLVLTEAQVSELFAKDIKQYEKTVNDAVKVPLTQNQFDACVSICYNIGQKGFAGSTIVKRLNAGDVHGAADAIMMWNKPTAILSRRHSEQVQFLTEDSQPVPALPRIPVDHSESPVEGLQPNGAPTIAKTTDNPLLTLLKGIMGLFHKEPA